MTIKEAVVLRFKEVCAARGIKYNELANLAGIAPSTLYSILDGKSQNPTIVTIKILCDGLDMNIAEFFDTDYFRSLEQEIK